MITRESILAGPKREPVAVDVAGERAFLRHPTFSEWRGIVARNAEGGKPTTAEAAAKAVAILLVNESGARLFPDGDSALLLNADPNVVATLYSKAWDTVMVLDDDRVEVAKGE